VTGCGLFDHEAQLVGVVESMLDFLFGCFGRPQLPTVDREEGSVALTFPAAGPGEPPRDRAL
jgi:hypothetical protein